MDQSLQSEIPVDYAKAAVPFPQLQPGEIVERVVETLYLGKRTYTFHTNQGRTLTREID